MKEITKNYAREGVAGFDISLELVGSNIVRSVQRGPNSTTMTARTSKKFNEALCTSTRISSFFKLATAGSGALMLNWSLEGCA